MRNLLPLSYFVLGLVLVAAVAGYVFAGRNALEWLQELSLNLGTEVAGILLTVVLIDAVIRRNEAAERRRVQVVAFQQLRIPLLRQLQFLQGMYKAAIAQLPSKLPTSASELFTDNYFDELGHLDLSKSAPVASITPMQWIDYLKMETERFKAALARTLDKYANFLDSETVELLEELLASTYLAFMDQAHAVRDLDRKENFVRRYTLLAGDDMKRLARRYTTQFLELLHEYNTSVPFDRRLALDQGLWRNDVGPQVGSGRA